MKKILLLASVMAMSVGINAQTIISEHFDSGATPVGNFVAESLDSFDTWGSAPGTAEDALITDTVATSGTRSFVVTGAATDLILQMGAWDKGSFEVSMKFMVGIGSGGYFNLQKEETPGIEWAGDVFFSEADTGYLALAGTDYPFNYTTGAWTSIKYYISLDMDTAMLYVNGAMVHAWQWSINGSDGTAGLNTLGGIDFFAFSPGGLNVEYYVDDVTVTRIPAKSMFNETMEAGQDGMLIAESLGAPWDTWSGAPGTAEDAVVSNLTANGGINSLYLSDAGTDLIYRFGDLTTGRYELSFDIKVDASSGAYYNLMHDFDGAFEWALEVVFNGDGTGNQSGGNTDAPFDYIDGDWNRVEYVIDLDNDNAKFFMNGKKVQDWQWSLNDANGDPGLNQLAVLDMFPAGSTNPSYYIDNLNVQKLTSIGASDIEMVDCAAFYTEEYFAMGDPQWSTWSDAPGTSEDAMVTDSMSFSGENSLELVGGVGTDVIYRFGDMTSGALSISAMAYVPTGGNGYFNLMHEFDNVNNAYMWALDVYMEDGGSGYIHAGGQATAATFDYPMDAWFEVIIYIDMNNDFANLMVDGNLIHEWQWSLDAQDAASSLNQLAVIDIFPPNATARFFMDDITFTYAEIGLSVEENVDSELSIYPNPANDVIFIMNTINEEVNLHVYNVAGQEVMNVQRVVNSGLIEIPVADLNNGIYLIQLENSNIQITKRIIVQH